MYVASSVLSQYSTRGISHINIHHYVCTCGVRPCLGWGEYTKAPYLGTIAIARNEQRHYLNGMLSGTIRGLIHTLIGTHDDLCDNEVDPANTLID